MIILLLYVKQQFTVGNTDNTFLLLLFLGKTNNSQHNYNGILPD